MRLIFIIAALAVLTGCTLPAARQNQTGDNAGLQPDPYNIVSPTPGYEPTILAADQTIQGGWVNIAEVITPVPGWIVIYSQGNNMPGSVLGYVYVDRGTSLSVRIRVDSSRLTDTLYAVLHADMGKPYVFEYPGPDMPLRYRDSLVMSDFRRLYESDP